MGVCDSRTGRSTGKAYLRLHNLVFEKVPLFFSESAELAGEMVFLGGVLGLLVPTRSFLDRFTPNLFGTWDVGTYSRGISSCFGLRQLFGTIRVIRTGVGHFQNPENEIFLFMDTDIRVRPNQVDTVIYISYIDHRTKRFGQNWSIFDSFLSSVVLTLLERRF